MREDKGRLGRVSGGRRGIRHSQVRRTPGVVLSDAARRPQRRDRSGETRPLQPGLWRPDPPLPPRTAIPGNTPSSPRGPRTCAPERPGPAAGSGHATWSDQSPFRVTRPPSSSSRVPSAASAGSRSFLHLQADLSPAPLSSWSWASLLPALNLRFHVCKVGAGVPTSRGCGETEEAR